MGCRHLLVLEEVRNSLYIFKSIFKKRICFSGSFSFEIKIWFFFYSFSLILDLVFLKYLYVKNNLLNRQLQFGHLSLYNYYYFFIV